MFDGHEPPLENPRMTQMDYAARRDLRRSAAPAMPKPLIISAKVAGSGIVQVDYENGESARDVMQDGVPVPQGQKVTSVGKHLNGRGAGTQKVH